MSLYMFTKLFMLNYLMKYFVMILSMILAVLGQFLFKKGVVLTNVSPNIKSIISSIFTPTLFFGFICYGVSAVLWLFVLKKFPLSVAYPSLAFTYILVLLISVIFFNESLSIFKIFGVILIFSGVVLINIQK